MNTRLASIVCLLALVPPGTMVVQSAPRAEFVIEHVSVHDLGALAGGSGEAYDINNQGEAVGWSHTAAGLIHAALFRDGTVVDIGAWHPARESQARRINDAGLAVGFSRFSRGGHLEQRAFAWIGGWLVDLDVTILAGDADCGRQTDATAVDDDGVIVGTSWDRVAGFPCVAETRVARWAGPAASPLTLSAPTLSTRPMDVAGSTVVGWQLRDFGSGLAWHAVRRSAGVWFRIPLPSPPDGARDVNSAATSINARGDIVGWRWYARGLDDVKRAFVWTAGTPRAYELDLPGSAWMRAEGINDDRFVVGAARLLVGGVTRTVPFLYHPSLGMRILPGLPHLADQHCTAYGLNERNPATGAFQVVGSCRTAVRVDPVRWEIRAVRPPPSTTP